MSDEATEGKAGANKIEMGDVECIVTYRDWKYTMIYDIGDLLGMTGRQQE